MGEQNGQGTWPNGTARPRRNAKATRQAILESARQAFTRSGYDGVGVREIAQNAGVTAMLVNRYFGSKEKLFEEAAEATLAVPGILRSEISKVGNDLTRLGQALATELVTATAPGRTLDGILLLVRSASNEQAATILRENALRHLKPLIDILPGEHASERAAMFLAVAAGFQLMRRVIALPALTEADASHLVTYLQDIINGLINDNRMADNTK